MRRAFPLLALLAFLPLARPAAALPEWRLRYAAVGRLCQNPREARECLDSLNALRAEIPGHPSILSAIGHTAMRLGDTTAVLAALESYAAMGMQKDLLADTAYIALHDSPRFHRIAQAIAERTAPIVRSREVHRFRDPDLMPEGIAWDSRRKAWLIGSVHRGTISMVSSEGEEKPAFTKAPWPRWGVYALGVDPKRRLLWASIAATAELQGGAGADSGRTALLCLDLDKGELVRGLQLPPDSIPHVLGDLAVAPDGTVYLTDSEGGGVYRAKPGEKALETLMPPGSFLSPQTPVPLIDGRHVLVPDYARGIASLDVETRTITWLEQPGDLAAVGIDGLYPWHGELIAIQNGVSPHRVVGMTLDPGAKAILRWRVIEQGSPSLGEPNHGVIVGDVMTLIGNSGWDRVGDDGTLTPAAPGSVPVLLRLPLSK